MARRRGVEAGGAAPLGDLAIGEAEAAMRLLLPQEFERVRCKIGDDQDTVRAQNARRSFAARTAWCS